MTVIKKYWTIWRTRFLILLGVIGPGIITGTADNDAGGITTYSVVGSHFGYQMLWMLFIIGLILAITQEMGARLGLVTGKGLAALIREHFSLKTTTFIVLITFLANFTNVVAEYAGLSSVADLYGVPRWLTIILSGFAIFYIVYRGSFAVVQRVFLTSSVLFLAYLIAGVLAHPNWGTAMHNLLVPSVEWSGHFFYTAVAMIGTTITAWGQFFVQSYYVDKGVESKHLTYSRLDIFVGSAWTIVVAFFIILATAATLHLNGLRIDDAGQAAAALAPLAGGFAKHLFAWGLLNASLLGLAVVSMTSAYIVTEAFGWEGRVDLKQESPAFYKIFGFNILAAALLMMIPQLPLVPIIIGSQALNTFVLPFLFVAIIILLNKRSLMGRHRNHWLANLIAWSATVFLVVMSGALLVMTFL